MQPSVKILDEGVLLELAWSDVVPLDALLLRPVQDRHAGELGTVVRDDHGWSAADGNEIIELACDPKTGQRRVGNEGQAFPG